MQKTSAPLVDEVCNQITFDIIGLFIPYSLSLHEQNIMMFVKLFQKID
jgi:hypothetical protein